MPDGADKRVSEPELHQIRDEITREMLPKLRRRRFGYAFGGPDDKWCLAMLSGATRDSGAATAAEAIADASCARLELSRDPDLPSEDKRPYGGCRKYVNCDIIPAELKWKRIEEMTADEIEQLKAIGCYRVTGQGTRSSWDVEALPSRAPRDSEDESVARWIGNPFGLRTTDAAEFAARKEEQGRDLREHRDFSPCPVGGCVTPEMQRGYEHDTQTARGADDTGSSEYWRDFRACPFYYRHTRPALDLAAPNSQRFVQCYLMRERVRRVLERLGLIVVAPVLRGPSFSASLESTIWYPFYSGYSFVQLPSRAPTAESWRDRTLPTRWMLTNLARQHLQRTGSQPSISRSFNLIDSGSQLGQWEWQNRVFSVCEGHASAMLLQWVLMRRLQAAFHEAGDSGCINIVDRLTWVFSSPDSPMPERFAQLAEDLARPLDELAVLTKEFEESDRGRRPFYQRTSTLREDLRLLGLVDDRGVVSDRFTHCLRWLEHTFIGDSQEALQSGTARDHLPFKDWFPAAAADTLRIYLREIRERDLQGADACAPICWLLLRLACCAQMRAGARDPTCSCLKLPADELPSERHLGDLSFQSADPQKNARNCAAAQLQWYAHADEPGSFRHFCRLVPEMHVLVRANWNQPLRWLMLPLSHTTSYVKTEAGPDEQHAGVGRLHSAILVMMEDDTDSQSYSSDYDRYNDQILRRVDVAWPLLQLVGSIEEVHVREDVMEMTSWMAYQRGTFGFARHFLAEMHRELRRIKQPWAEWMTELVDLLAANFLTLPETQVGTSHRPFETADFGQCAQNAIKTFNRWMETRGHRRRAVLESLGSRFLIQCSLLEDIYSGENREAVRRRIQSSLRLLLLHLLLERHDNSDRVVLRLHSDDELNQVIAEVVIPGGISEDLHLVSPPDPVEKLPRDRGLFTTMAVARSLGSVRQEIGNHPTKPEGFVRLMFRKAEE